ncbi:hypothetical protein QRD43_21365 [Pelomonas sp. APW6]|uniref:Uncharacterized protein n=1 Tax=Roseateles subflavus TaxID=3053353 RepID=A0ABT7LQH3_9BURK|nr:hypothetical protein [Pelomonas sp. APW6]MDL5034467.1 hypothetical protein [Pelomonas sp. APW6]
MSTRPTPIAANPFAMLLDPEQYAREAAHSDRLNRLRSRIYRPLDKPLIPKAVSPEQAAFDRLVDKTRLAPEDFLDDEGIDAGMQPAALDASH